MPEFFAYRRPLPNFFADLDGGFQSGLNLCPHRQWKVDSYAASPGASPSQ